MKTDKCLHMINVITQPWGIFCTALILKVGSHAPLSLTLQVNKTLFIMRILEESKIKMTGTVYTVNQLNVRELIRKI